MEKRHGGRRRVALTSPKSSDWTDGSTLRNFIIPKKKRAVEKALLEPCPNESRDYCCILSTLRDSALDQLKDFSLSWECQDVKLAHNEELLREFSEKRSEMRSKGRHFREMEERFCFLVTSCKNAEQLCQHGLKTDKMAQHTLGNPSHGVYLYRHVDVALKNSKCRSIVVFKVILGKVKRVLPSLGKHCIQDPTVHYDCYISKEPAGPKDTLLQQVLGSSIFLFDYNENQELNTRPRQCLPYAVVLVAPNSNTSSTVSGSIPVSLKMPSLGITLGSGKHKPCTVAERWGKGHNATVTFRHIGTIPEKSIRSFGCQSIDLGTSSLQQMDHVSVYSNTSYQEHPNSVYNLKQAFGYYTIQQQWAASFYPTESYATSTSFYPTESYETSASFYRTEPYVTSASFMPEPTFLFPTSNIGAVQNTLGQRHQVYSNICTNQKSQYQRFDLPITVAHCVPKADYLSKVVKDPRLHGQENKILKRKSVEKPEQDFMSGQISSKHVPARECLSQPCYQKEGLSQSGCENGTRGMPKSKEHTQTSTLEILLPGSPEHPGNEQPPSIHFLKMKFKKYAAYLAMTDKERVEKIGSLENVPQEEKKLLLDRINFYSTCLQSYKKGFHFQSDQDSVTDIDVRPVARCVNPVCFSTTGTNVRCNPELGINAHNLVLAVPQKVPEDRCPETQPVRMQKGPLGSDHFLPDTTLVSVDSSHKHCSGTSGNLTHTSCLNDASPVQTKEVDECTKNKTKNGKTETKPPQRRSAIKIKDGCSGFIAVCQTDSETVSFTQGATTSMNEPLDPIPPRLGQTNRCSKQTSDKKTFSHFLKPCSEKTKAIEVCKNYSKKPVNASSATISKEVVFERTSIPTVCCLGQPESYEWKNCRTQNPEVNFRARLLTGDDSQENLLSSSSMENSEAMSGIICVSKECYNEFMDVAACEELNVIMDVSEEPVYSNVVPNIETIQDKNNNVENNTLFNYICELGEDKTEASHCHSTHDCTGNIHKAHVDDKDSLMSDTVLCKLNMRMQFNPFFFTPSPQGENALSDKSYLRPRSLGSHMDNQNQSKSVKNTNPTNKKYALSKDMLNHNMTNCTCREISKKCHFLITIKPDKVTTSFAEPEILSKRFPIIEYLQAKIKGSSAVIDEMETNSNIKFA